MSGFQRRERETTSDLSAPESFTSKTVGLDPWKVQHINHQLHLQRKGHVVSDRQPYCSGPTGPRTRGLYSGQQSRQHSAESTIGGREDETSYIATLGTPMTN
jgi:hypothetical protein